MATTPLWRQIQRTNFTKVDELIAFLELSKKQATEIALSPSFVLNLPQRLANKIQKATR